MPHFLPFPSKQNVEFTGRYRLVNSTCFDELLKELGIGFFLRGIATRVKPDLVISKNGDIYTQRTISSVRSTENSFKLNGELFDETRADGETVKTSMTQSGNKWIQRQSGNPEVLIVREFTGKSIVITSVVNNIASVRVYNRY
jgi:hypothetical protein